MPIDILVFAAHPDDAELGCSGTIAHHVKQGYSVGIIDLTQGELGTRGTPEIRKQEAEAASKILQLSIRENLQLKDGFISDSEQECLKVITMIRKYKPQVIICNAPEDRHPDHGAAFRLIEKAHFLAGLRKIETFHEQQSQQAWRASKLYSYIQDRYLQPDFVLDISDYWDTKKASILAYQTQFWNPSSAEPATYISSSEFLEFIEARSKELGHSIGVKYGEGFLKHQQLQLNNLISL